MGPSLGRSAWPSSGHRRLPVIQMQHVSLGRSAWPSSGPWRRGPCCTSRAADCPTDPCPPPYTALRPPRCRSRASRPVRTHARHGISSHPRLAAGNGRLAAQQARSRKTRSFSHRLLEATLAPDTTTHRTCSQEPKPSECTRGDSRSRCAAFASMLSCCQCACGSPCGSALPRLHATRTASRSENPDQSMAPCP